MSVALDCRRPTDDLVDDVTERCGGVDHDTICQNALLCAMQTQDEVALRLPPSSPVCADGACAELVLRPLIEAPVQGLHINL